MAPYLRISLLLVFFCLIQKAFAQKDERIFWHQDSLLKWTDFKGAVDTNSKYSALNSCGIEYAYKATLEDGKYTVRFKTKAYFVQSKSWSKVARQTPKLLKHEQLHFDIVEFFSRKELAALTNHVYNASYRADIALIDKRIAQKKDEMQFLYDSQTNHFINEAMQAKWEVFVAKILKENYSLDHAMANMPIVDSPQITTTSSTILNPSQ